MKRAVQVAIPILFFAPAFTTYLGGPYIGIGLSGIYLFFHYYHRHFDGYLKDDPMDLDSDNELFDFIK